MNILIRLLIILVYIPGEILSRSDDIQFEYLTVEDGLSSSIAKCIVQDSSGFIWIGTDNGLNRYDGYEFIQIKHIPFDTTSLSDNFIKTLCVDRFGYLWIGTSSGGLNRYDPRTESFLIFRHNPYNPSCITSDEITTLCPDMKGNLWIGTDKHGLNKLLIHPDSLTTTNIRFEHFTSPYTFEHQFNKPEKPENIAGKSINTVFEDSKGTIWIGTFTGLSRLSLSQEKQLHIKNYRHDPLDSSSLSYNDISSICEDKAGNIWIGTCARGISKFNPYSEKFEHNMRESGNDNSLSHYYITKLQLDQIHNNILWISTKYGGINRLNLTTGKIKNYKTASEFYPHKEKHVLDIHQDISGMIWGTEAGEGIFKFDPWRGKFNKYLIETEQGKAEIISSIYVNPNTDENLIWLTSAGGGFLKYNKSRNTFNRYLSHSPSKSTYNENLIICLLGEVKPGNPTENILWFGGDFVGPAHFDTEKKQFTYFYKKSTHILSKIRSQVQIYYPDPLHENIIWIGTGAKGLFKYDRKNQTLNQYRNNPDNPKSLNYNCVHRVLRDHAGRLWIGTRFGGLNRMNETEGTFVRYTHNPLDTTSLSYDWINGIFESGSGVLWIATRDGLNRLNTQNNSFQHFGVKEGLPGNAISAILEDKDNNLWLTTSNGISRFNPAVTLKKAFRNYGVGDGLHGKEFSRNSCFQSKTGEIYAGGIGGFTVFHPDHIEDNLHIPKILITDLIINQKSIQPGDNSPLKQSIPFTKELLLSYHQNTLTFEFAALDYLNPLKNKYAYKMDGLDRDWIYIGAKRRYANYNQIDPGKYVFRVKGSNNDGIWNNRGTSLNITILPPWWRTTWAYMVYILLVLSLLIAIYAYDRKRQRLKHELEIEHVNAEKLQEIDHMKSRFFANLSHEFRTPLTLILGPAQILLEKIRDADMKDKVEVISRNASRLNNLVGQLLDLSRLEAGKMKLKVQRLDFIPLIRKLVLAFNSLAERKKIDFQFKSYVNSLKAYLDVDKVEKIINNLLSNAFKFTPENGRIDIKIIRGEIFNSKESGKQYSTGGKDSPQLQRNPDSDFVKILVTNNGPAIPADKIGYIFDRFYRVDDSDTHHEGAGIGLSLVKELVELHHGTITAQSDEAGTIFTLCLPVNPDLYAEDEIVEEIATKTELLPDESTEMLTAEPLKRRQPERVDDMPEILLIEDNVDMRTYIGENLQNCYRIIEAANGQQGYDLAVKQIPELVISDIMMPEMDGFQVCQKIKTNVHTSHMPVILLTARAELSDKIRGLETGADDYIPKPFEISELQVRIKNLIDQRRRLKERFSRDAMLQPVDIAVSSLDKKFLTRALKIIEREMSNEAFNVDKFVREMGVSRAHLYNKLHALTGMSAKEFIRTMRLKRSAQLIRKQYGNISQIAYDVGFKNPAYFSVCFHKQFGRTPSQYAQS